MAQLTITENYWTVISRNPDTCFVYKEEYYKGIATTDEQGNVVGYTTELVKTVEYQDPNLIIAPPMVDELPLAVTPYKGKKGKK